ncbi:PREDICTED: mucin-5AC-like [Amphimedon queenslandica]|uniref:Uncharacterized protein n=1 Tax=Amphimedon queenslandica TaxID=400682 RepID=A0A1X7VD51_AMPQE|nr:PREDICTED: mucin-5AC-like [Amphimedon queenslandica]|eukprot:XP_019849724.1 PREDICTED: mucin-5AC-like [Amphimedon queenslandica]
MSDSEENQYSSPPVASEEALSPPDEFSTISKVEEENISGEIEIDVGKGLLDEVSKEVAGKINYDGLLISTSLLDKGDYKPIEDEEFDFDIPEEHFNISLTGVTQTSIESDSFDLDTFLGIRKLHTAGPSTDPTPQPPGTEAAAATQEEPDQVQESVLLPSAVEGSQEVAAGSGEDDNVLIPGPSCIGDDVVALNSNQQLDNEDNKQENNNDNITSDPPPATIAQTSVQTDGDKLTSNEISPIVEDKAPPIIADTPLDAKKFPADDETPYSDYVTPPTRIHEISSETSGAITADSADFSSSSYSSTCLMTADTKLSPIKAPLQGEGVESDTKKDVPSIRTSSLRKPSAKKGAFSSSPFDSEGSASASSATFVKDSTFTVSKNSGSENNSVSLSNETQILETAGDNEGAQDNKKTQNGTFCSSASSGKSEGITGSTKIAKSRLVKPSSSTTATTAGKSKLVRPSSARTASSTAATGLNKKPIKPNLMVTKGKTLATTTRPGATKQQPMAARGGGGTTTSTSGLKSKSAPSITSKGSGGAPANKPLIKGPSNKTSLTKGIDKTDGAGVGVGVKKGSVRSGLVPPSVTSRPSSAKAGSQVVPPTKGKSLLTRPVARKPALGGAMKKPEEIKRKKKLESTKDVGVTETDSNQVSDVTTPTTRRHSTGDTPKIKSDATPNRLKRRSFIPTPTRITDKEARPISCQFDDHLVKRAAQSRFRRPVAPPKGGAKTNGTKPVETAKPPEDPVESEEVEFEYDPEYEKQLLSLTSKPKVFHSPLNKENLQEEPHSEWSPIPRRMTYLPGDESIQCTKYTHIKNNS